MVITRYDHKPGERVFERFFLPIFKYTLENNEAKASDTVE
jgi:hypothetical protein